MSSSEILIKAKYNDTIRRFVYDAGDSSWSNFFAFLSNKFSSSSLINFTVKYYDEEGDLITIDSDHELNSVFEECCQEGKQLKLQLFTDAALHAFNKYKTKKEKKWKLKNEKKEKKRKRKCENKERKYKQMCCKRRKYGCEGFEVPAILTC